MLTAVCILWRKYLHKTLKHPEEIVGMLIQPLLWVLLFGVGMGAMLSGEEPESGGYMTFMLPGIIALTAVGAAIAGGSTWLSERLSGVVKKYEAAPIPRISILLGHTLSIVTKVLIQALIILFAGLLMGARLSSNPLGWLGGFLLVSAYGIGFSGVAIAVASSTESSEGYHMLIFLLQLPLLFLSNSLYPLAALPAWMRFGAYGNPTTYLVTGVRRLALSPAASGGAASIPIWLCFSLCALFALFGLLAALRAFTKVRG